MGSWAPATFASLLLVALAGPQPLLATSSPGLRPTRWQRIPTGRVKPRGWLEAQARLQAGALTSHLPLFWPNVANTSWLGGPADVDGGLHESTPYWLNGAVPLALQLEDQVLQGTVERYIDGILARQATDGWLGPDTDPSDFWSRYSFLLALAQHHEALPAASPRRRRILAAAVRFFGAVAARLASGTPLASWSYSRAHDLIWAIHYFVDAVGAEPDADPRAAAELLALSAALHAAAFDWHGAWFNSSDFPRAAVTGTFTAQTHGVNNAQALKQGVVWARQSGDAAAGTAESWHAWEMLMQYHGMPNGIFSADEHLAGRMPSRGTELCAVVEAMWSLALMAQTAPTDSHATRALDALEAIAFNALPGSLSDDLWSHPYLQFVNSFQAVRNETDHVWANDGPDSAMYGLVPNYECCTANFHQGYPKLITHLFFTLPEENTLVSTIWAPSTASVPDVGGGVEVTLRTRYPFGKSASYVIRNPEAFRLKIRLPAFLREVAGPSQGLATVRVWREGHEQIVELVDGFLEYELPAWPLPEPRVAIRIVWAVVPQVRRADSAEQGMSVFVGPLLMSLDLGEQRRAVQSYPFGAADWDTTASRPWQYGLPASRPTPWKLAFRAPGALPFKHSAAACPLVMNATLARLAEGDWPAAQGSPGPLPRPGGAAGTSSFLPEERLLLPYACTGIRIAAFPVSALAWVV